MNFSMPNMPGFIKREMEKLQEFLSPFMKKVSKYVFWSFPLTSIAIVNLFLIMFVIPGKWPLTAIFLYAVMGAFGLALSKEAKLQRKEVQKRSAEYIINRIRTSEAVPETSKNEYIRLVKQEPLQAMNYFVRFLEEENRIASAL